MLAYLDNAFRYRMLGKPAFLACAQFNKINAKTNLNILIFRLPLPGDMLEILDFCCTTQLLTLHI